METKDIVYIALFAALTAALGLFPPLLLPGLGVPITTQSLGPMLAGSILGARRGALSQALFLVLVAVGLPLLAGGRGGFGVLVGLGGGFLVGWVAAAAVIGFLIERFWHGLVFPTALACNVVGGIAALYLLGIPWMAHAGGTSLTAAAYASLTFIPGDLVKAVLAAAVAIAVKRAHPIIRPAGASMPK